MTSWPSGRSTFVRSPAGYRTSVHVPLDKSAIGRTTFTVRALNQDGWSARSDPLRGTVYGPNVSVTSPTSGAKLARGFTVTVEATPDSHTHSPPTSAWAEVGSVACTSEDGSGPYDLVCAGAPRGRQTLTVHVENAVRRDRPTPR